MIEITAEIRALIVPVELAEQDEEIEAEHRCAMLWETWLSPVSVTVRRIHAGRPRACKKCGGQKPIDGQSTAPMWRTGLCCAGKSFSPVVGNDKLA